MIEYQYDLPYDEYHMVDNIELSKKLIENLFDLIAFYSDCDECSRDIISILINEELIKRTKRHDSGFRYHRDESLVKQINDENYDYEVELNSLIETPEEKHDAEWGKRFDDLYKLESVNAYKLKGIEDSHLAAMKNKVIKLITDGRKKFNLPTHGHDISYRDKSFYDEIPF